MTSFPGFPPGKIRHTRIPDPFFTELLPVLDNLAEMKIILYAFWFMEQQEESLRMITYQDFASDQRFMQALGAQPETVLADALEKAVQRGVLLKAAPQENGDSQAVYFINTPRGRAAMAAIRAGSWSPNPEGRLPVALEENRPNIYRLYEQNIGPLTPLMAEALQSADQAYPPEWIHEAFTIAVQKNARNWRFIQAVLKTWQEKGRNEGDRRDDQENRHRYVEGEYGDLIEH